MARMRRMIGVAWVAPAVSVAVLARVALAAARCGGDLGALIDALGVRRVGQLRDLGAVPLAVALPVGSRVAVVMRGAVPGAHGGVRGRPRGCLRRCLPLESGLGCRRGPVAGRAPHERADADPIE